MVWACDGFTPFKSVLINSHRKVLINNNIKKYVGERK